MSKRITALVDGSPTVLCRITFEPTPNWRKSTITSTRSAGSIGIARRTTGAGSRPPSEPIWTILRPLPSSSSKARALAALRKRKRYSRRSTFIRGATAPLTRIVSPRKPRSRSVR